MTLTPIADMVDAMVATDASSAAIAVAVRSFEQIVTRHAPSRDASRTVTVLSTSPGAIRARRSRQNRKQNQHMAEANDAAKAGAEGMTPERDASRDAVTAHCELTILSSSNPQVETEKASKENRAVVVEGRKRGTRLAADATISADDFQFAGDAGMQPAAIDQAWAEFRDYWIGIPGQRGTKLDWSATWRNRVRQIATRKQERADGRRGNILPAIDRLNDKLREFDRSDEPDMLPDLRGGAGAPDVRVLPPRGRQRS